MRERRKEWMLSEYRQLLQEKKTHTSQQLAALYGYTDNTIRTYLKKARKTLNQPFVPKGRQKHTAQ